MAGALLQIDTWPVRTAAAGVVSGEGTLGTAGPAALAFPWASVTKVLTALAVLVAVEEGILGLEEAAGPQGSTVRHLLAHASGLPPDGATPLARPGTRRIYSNTGFEALGAMVSERAGVPFAGYLAAGVLEPLGLAGTVLAGSPASGAVGPLTDLLTVGRQLQAPTVIAAETLASATTVQFAGLAGVLPGFGRQDPNDWGLGFEIRDDKEPHWTGTRNSPATFGHFGRSGAMLWVDPAAGLACASLADHPFGAWAAEAWPRLSDAVLAEFSGV